MRKSSLILVLSAVALIASTNDAFAQRRGGFSGGRGGGYSRGYGGNFGGYNYGQGYYGSGYYNPGYHNHGYYSNPGYYGTYNYSAPYYYGNDTYYSDPIVTVPPNEIRQSYYSDPSSNQAATNQAATVVVLTPTPDAEVWFDGNATSQRGMDRSFQTPALQLGGTYSYTIRARWMENGQAVDRERRVNVQPGQSVTVNFRS